MYCLLVGEGAEGFPGWALCIAFPKPTQDFVGLRKNMEGEGGVGEGGGRG